MGCRELDITSYYRFVEPSEKSHSREQTSTEKTAYSRFSHTVISNYRYYSPELGRWLKRDMIEEWGGFNLYAMVLNNPVLKWDYLGFGVGDVLNKHPKVLPHGMPFQPDWDQTPNDSAGNMTTNYYTWGQDGDGEWKYEPDLDFSKSAGEMTECNKANLGKKDDTLMPTGKTRTDSFGVSTKVDIESVVRNQDTSEHYKIATDYREWIENEKESLEVKKYNEYLWFIFECVCEKNNYFWKLQTSTKTERVVNIKTRTFSYHLIKSVLGTWWGPTALHPGSTRPDLLNLH